MTDPGSVWDTDLDDSQQTDLDGNVGPAVASVAENRAVDVATARRARHETRELAARARTSLADAEEARRLAVSALAEADGLRRALQTRADIDMAKGIMIALHGVDPDTAFEMLRRESQRSHTKLSEVAKRLITTTITRPSPPTS